MKQFMKKDRRPNGITHGGKKENTFSNDKTNVKKYVHGRKIHDDHENHPK